MDADKVNVRTAALANKVCAMCHIVGVVRQQLCAEDAKHVGARGAVGGWRQGTTDTHSTNAFQHGTASGSRYRQCNRYCGMVPQLQHRWWHHTASVVVHLPARCYTSPQSCGCSCGLVICSPDHMTWRCCQLLPHCKQHSCKTQGP